MAPPKKSQELRSIPADKKKTWAHEALKNARSIARYSGIRSVRAKAKAEAEAEAKKK